jgi:tetratricopeptide (TPR) repeat protein
LLNRRAAAQFQDAKMIETFTDRAEYNSRRFQPDYVVTISDEARKKYGAALRVETARKFVQGKQWEQAIPILREVVDATSAPDATILLAGCELEAGRPKKSIQLLEDLTKRRGSMTTAMLLLGDAYAAAGQSQQAIDIWRILETVRSGPALNQRLAAQYEKTGQAAAAQKQRALELQSEGIGLLRQANPVRAKQSLEAATRLDETVSSAWFYLGECYRVTGDKQGAKRAYSKAHELAPNHGRAASKLALLEEEGGSP